MHEIKEEKKVKREYTVLSLKRDPSTEEQAILRHYVRTGDLDSRKKVAELIQGEELRGNLTPLAGRNVYARRASGDTTYTGEINYGALGSGTTAFDDNTETLNTEVYRKIKSDSAFDGDICYTDWFILSGDVANQTFQEFMAVIDGTASADTGQAISAVITGGWIKSGSMFISLKLTFV